MIWRSFLVNAHCRTPFTKSLTSLRPRLTHRGRDPGLIQLERSVGTHASVATLSYRSGTFFHIVGGLLVLLR